MYNQHHPHDVVLYGKVIFSPVALLFPHVLSLTYRRIRVSSYIKMCRNDDGAVFFSPSIPLNGHLICLALEHPTTNVVGRRKHERSSRWLASRSPQSRCGNSFSTYYDVITGWNMAAIYFIPASSQTEVPQAERKENNCNSLGITLPHFSFGGGSSVATTDCTLWVWVCVCVSVMLLSGKCMAGEIVHVNF